jgi:nucleotide-binding universal stress UspA family protein
MSGVDTAPILCAIDFSPGSLEALARARRLARAEARPLRLLHVVHAPRFSFAAAPLPTPRELTRSLAEIASERLRAYARAEGDGIAAEAHVLEGEPWRRIVELAADARADLIVLGAHGEGALLDRVLGSVAERVVRHAPTSVLVVRSGGAADPR